MLEGKRYHKACKGATGYKEAEQFAYDYKSNVYKGKQGYVKCNTTKLDKLIEIYLDYSKTNKKSYSLDCYYCRNFKGFIGNRYIDEIKLIDIEKFKSFRKNTVSNSTINRELNSISKMFSIAVENKLLSENPCFSVKKLRENNMKERFLTKEEEEKLLSACIGEKEYLKPILMMALHTGCRKSEILRLTWDCVDFTQKFITILNSKSGKSRQIPMSEKLYDFLYNQPKINKYVFINPETQKPYYDLKKAFKGLCGKEEVNIKDLRFHDLRHTAATRMVASGIDIRVVQDILGHSDIRMTQRYSHPVPERKLKAIEALNNY